MKVFVAGASGAIGRPLVPRLVAGGHHVTGMTRSEERAEELRRAGAEAVVADVFDSDRVTAALATAEPEVVVHQLTALPKRLDLRKMDEAYAGTNRLRTEGTRILMAAARAAGARRMVAQSIAFLYAPEGDAVKDEDARAFTDAPEPFGGAVRALMDMEAQVTGAAGIEGVVLRYGWFYGPGTFYAADGSSADDVRRRRQPVVGKGSGCSASSTQTTPPRPRWRPRRAGRREPSMWWTTTQHRSASGYPPTPMRSVPSRPGTCRAGWPAWRRRRCSWRWPPDFGAPRMRASRRSSGGSRATRAGGRGSATSWVSAVSRTHRRRP